MRFTTLKEAGMESTKDKIYMWVDGDSRPAPKSPTFPNPVPQHKFKYDPKPTETLKWLRMATAGDDEPREMFHYIHPTEKYTWAADGYRVNRVFQTGLVKKEYMDNIPDMNFVFREKHTTTVQVSRYHVLRAIAASEVFARDWSNILKLTVNGDMQFFSHNAEYGDSTVTISCGDQWLGVEPETRELKRSNYTTALYLKDGENVEIGVNYKYLRDAVLGMPETFNMGFGDATHPIVIWADVDGIKREACVMPMQIGR